MTRSVSWHMARRRDGDGAFEISYRQLADPFRSEAISLDGIGRRRDRGRRRLRPFRRVDPCGKDTARSCRLTVRHALAPSPATIEVGGAGEASSQRTARRYASVGLATEQGHASGAVAPASCAVQRRGGHADPRLLRPPCRLSPDLTLRLPQAWYESISLDSPRAKNSDGVPGSAGAGLPQPLGEY